MAVHELRKKAVKRGYHHYLIGVDIENNPDDGSFICAGIFGDIRVRTSVWVMGKPRAIFKTEQVEQYFTEQKAFEDYLLSLKANSCLLCFFNLPYDKIYLNNIIAPLKKRSDGTYDMPVLRNGTRIISLRLKNEIKAIDLTNIVEGSLENWINYLNMPEQYGVAKAELTKYFDRVMNDAKATYYLGKHIQNFYLNECGGISMPLTKGQGALKLFQQKYFTDYWYRDNDFLSLYERKSYYGGRTELFKKGKFLCYNYDVNSMYLSIMRDCLLPDVSTAKHIKNGRAYKKYFDRYLGIFNVRVKTPDKIYLPILPYRIDKKLKFPRGEFEGTFTSIELKKALEIGYKILKCYDFIYYRNAKPYFKEFAEFVWQKRVEFKKANNKGMDLLMKYTGNSLYGKFAQRNSNDFFGKIDDITELPDICEIFDYHGELWVRIKGELVPAKFEFPAIASFITSYARLKLYSGMAANADTLIYVDTDSLKLTAEARGIEIGSGLGQFSFEGTAENEFYRPKFYGDKCKGVPKRAEIVERTAEHIVFKYKKPLREREAVRRNLVPNVWVEVLKTATFADDKRRWFKSGKSLPITIDK